MKSNDKILIIAALVGEIIVLVATIGFVGQGNTRRVEIFWQEKVEQTNCLKILMESHILGSSRRGRFKPK